VRIGYPGGNGDAAENWLARLVGKNDEGNPRRSPAKQEKNASTMKG
jgi:hypothetical protein